MLITLPWILDFNGNLSNTGYEKSKAITMTQQVRCPTPISHHDRHATSGPTVTLQVLRRKLHWTPEEPLQQTQALPHHQQPAERAGAEPLLPRVLAQLKLWLVCARAIDAVHRCHWAQLQQRRGQQMHWHEH